jgi:hypothetical protein
MAIEIVDNNFSTLILNDEYGGETNPLIVNQLNVNATDSIIVFAVFWINSEGNNLNPVNANITSTVYGSGFQPELLIEQSDGISSLNVYYVVSSDIGSNELKITFDDANNPNQKMQLTASVTAISFTGIDLSMPVIIADSNRVASSEIVQGFTSAYTTNLCIDFISAVIQPYLDNILATSWGNIEISNNTFGTDISKAIVASSINPTTGEDGIFAWSLNNVASLVWGMLELHGLPEYTYESETYII